MTLFHIFLLAMVEGITTFLPVSSSGHVVLLPALTPLEDQGPALELGVHLGTLLAVCWVFRADVARAARGLREVSSGRIETRGGFLALCLITASFPVAVLGLILMSLGLLEALRSLAVIGWMMIVFGLVLFLTDRSGTQSRVASGWTLKHALYLGLWQCLALVPGTSRAGAVISGARALGYTRIDAAKLSMLMSIPVIIASGSLVSVDAFRLADWQTARVSAVTAVVSFLAAWAAITVMMRLARWMSFTPYVLYRLGLGTALLIIAYG